jgi:rRNA maturation endonuclease Nob1
LSALVLILGVLLGLGVSAFVLLPIARSGKSSDSDAARSDDLLARRDRVYGEIRDLEFDVRVGKVTEEDYRDARERLEVEAARILQALDDRLRVVDDQIEHDVKRLRRRPDVCPACGTAIDPKARFCSSCGAGLTVASAR